MSFIGLILVYINMVKTKKVNEKKPVEWDYKYNYL